MVNAAAFWARVERRGDDECWPWRGAIDPKGYGTFGAIPGKTRKAHRIAYMLTHGDALTTEQLVCHHCDNPGCVNPSHLFVGTARDNMQDKVRKGRCNQRRECNNGAKLTAEIVALIRTLKRDGMAQRAIARRFHVSEALVSRVVRGLAWQ